jgi:hypothetical protein
VFRLKPQAVWHVAASRARLCGRDLGALAQPDTQAALADFWIPRRGLFVAGDVEMTDSAGPPRGVVA